MHGSCSRAFCQQHRRPQFEIGYHGPGMGKLASRCFLKWAHVYLHIESIVLMSRTQDYFKNLFNVWSATLLGCSSGQLLRQGCLKSCIAILILYTLLLLLWLSLMAAILSLWLVIPNLFEATGRAKCNYILFHRMTDRSRCHKPSQSLQHWECVAWWLCTSHILKLTWHLHSIELHDFDGSKHPPQPIVRWKRCIGYHVQQEVVSPL